MESDFQRLEDEWARAVIDRDAAAADRLLADDFILTSEGGVTALATREEWFETLPQLETTALTCTVVHVREFGDTAVVRVKLRWEASLGERDLTGDYAVVDVFARDGDGWRAAWRISVRLS